MFDVESLRILQNNKALKLPEAFGRYKLSLRILQNNKALKRIRTLLELS